MNQKVITNLTIRRAKADDLPVIQGLLRQLHLPTEGTDRHVPHFLVSESAGKVIGIVGLELYGQTGLLRSAAIEPRYQNKGVGNKLVAKMVEYAKELGVRELVLLTTTAKSYFEQRGFEQVERTAISGEVLASEEFKGACPSTATVMKKML